MWAAGKLDQKNFEKIRIYGNDHYVSTKNGNGLLRQTLFTQLGLKTLATALKWEAPAGDTVIHKRFPKSAIESVLNILGCAEPGRYLIGVHFNGMVPHIFGVEKRADPVNPMAVVDVTMGFASPIFVGVESLNFHFTEVIELIRQDIDPSATKSQVVRVDVFEPVFLQGNQSPS